MIDVPLVHLDCMASILGETHVHCYEIEQMDRMIGQQAGVFCITDSFLSLKSQQLRVGCEAVPFSGCIITVRRTKYKIQPTCLQWPTQVALVYRGTQGRKSLSREVACPWPLIRGLLTTLFAIFLEGRLPRMKRTKVPACCVHLPFRGIAVPSCLSGPFFGRFAATLSNAEQNIAEMGTDDHRILLDRIGAQLGVAQVRVMTSLRLLISSNSLQIGSRSRERRSRPVVVEHCCGDIILLITLFAHYIQHLIGPLPQQPPEEVVIIGSIPIIINNSLMI